MVNAGRVAIVPQGEWSADATYKRLDAVTYNNTLYFAKKDVPAGTVTSNTEYWSKSIVGDAGAIATTEAAGIVKPDGTTITIDDDGTIHGQSEITVDGTTITLDEAKGIISLAKTLQDKIKTIDNKLPKTSVVNTNTTTEAGFALDARQANPNIEGTLAANILQLNNDLNDINGSLTNVKTDLASKAKKYYSYSDGMFTTDRAYNEGLVNSAQPSALERTMWLILAQRMSVSDSCVLLGNFYSGAWHLTEIQKSSTMTVETNNSGTISVAHGGNRDDVLLTAIRLH